MTNMNVPKLRFTEFNTLWVKSSLNSISNIKTGFTPSTSNNSYWSGDYPWLSIADMNQGKYILNTSKTITKVATKNKSILKKGTLIMSFKLTIGKLSILEKDMYTNEAICGFNWKDNVNVSTEFMYYLLSSMNIKKYGSQAAKGITLNKDSLKSIPVQLPSIEEQFKIASFLLSVDNKIELLKDKKDKYVEFKHYLLQNLFPRNDELTPKLRFTKYNDEWNTVKLGDLMEKGKAGGTPTSSNKDYYGGTIPFLSINDMTSQGKYITYTSKLITQKGLENSSAWILPKNSLLYSIYASVGFVGINLINMATSQAIYGIILKKEVNIQYLYYYLLNFKRNLHKYIETGTQGNINAKILKNFKINIPSLDEQGKIASFLSSVDKKIDLLDQEIEYVEEYKKGLLQKMFC